MSTMFWNTEGTLTTGNQTAPEIAALSTGGWVVVWESGSSGSLVGNGQVFSAAGVPVGSQFTIPSQGGQTEDVQVTANNLGGFFVGWINTSTTEAYELYYDSDAFAVGNPFPVTLSSVTSIDTGTGPGGTLDGTPYLFWVSSAEDFGFSGLTDGQSGDKARASPMH